MIVVADTSPLIALINLGEIEVLPRLFNTVLIPKEVLQELGDLRRPSPVRPRRSGTSAG
jgi:predicted nucleic acid-binding protein